MKFILHLFLAASLFYSTTVYSQSNNLVIRSRSMAPLVSPQGSSGENRSVGLNLGYGKVFKGDHWGVDLTAFGDLMDYQFDIGAEKYFNGTTLFTGFSLTPNYCINPQSDYPISIALSIKAGNNFGYGTVYQYKNQEPNDPRLEDRSAKGGFEVALSPMIAVAFPIDAGSLGLELGYDSSNFGAGLNHLRSDYFSPIKYNSGYVFLGLFFRLHN